MSKCVDIKKHIKELRGVKALLILRNGGALDTLSELSKKIDCITGYGAILAKKLENGGYCILKKKTGRSKSIELTEKGKEVADILHKLIKKM